MPQGPTMLACCGVSENPTPNPCGGVAPRSSPRPPNFPPFCATLSGFGEEGSKIRVDPWKKKYKRTRYDSPALIVLDKTTGKLLARTTEDIFDLTFHGAHASPAWGVVNGRDILIYGGGNGTCY